MGDEVHGGMKARLDSAAFLTQSGRWRAFDTSMPQSKPVQLVRLAKALFWLLRQPRSTVFLVQYPMHPLHGRQAQRLIARNPLPALPDGGAAARFL